MVRILTTLATLDRIIRKTVSFLEKSYNSLLSRGTSVLVKATQKILSYLSMYRSLFIQGYRKYFIYFRVFQIKFRTFTFIPLSCSWIKWGNTQKYVATAQQKATYTKSILKFQPSKIGILSTPSSFVSAEQAGDCFLFTFT